MSDPATISTRPRPFPRSETVEERDVDIVEALWWAGVIFAVLAATTALMAVRARRGKDSMYLVSYILMSISMVLVVARSLL